MRSIFSRLLPLAALALACPAATPLPAQPTPCATVPGADSLTPLPTQPPGVYVLGAVGVAPVAVWRTDGRASVCLGRAEPQGKKWRAVVALADGSSVGYPNFGGVDAAVVAVWKRSTVALPQLPPLPPARPPGDSTPATPPAPTTLPMPALDSLASWIGSAPLVASAAVRAMGPAFARYDSAGLASAVMRWQADGSRYDWTYYDRARVFYALCGRSGDATWCARADSEAVAYRDQYLVPADYATSPHWSMLRGVYAHYRRTGDDRDRYAIARAAEVLWGGWANYMGAPTLTADSAHMAKADPRIQGRVLEAQQLARALGGHPSVAVQAWGAAPSYQARIDTMLAGLARWQPTTGPRAGAWPTDYACGGQNNFEAGILHDALIYTHAHDPHLTAAQRAAIVTLVARGVGYLWTQFVAGQGFPYGDLHLVTAGGGPATCATDNGTQLSPDLTGLMVDAFGWVYRQTGDVGWRARGDAVFGQLVTGWNLGDPYQGNGAKQFNQAFTSSWQYLGWR